MYSISHLTSIGRLPLIAVLVLTPAGAWSAGSDASRQEFGAGPSDGEAPSVPPGPSQEGTMPSIVGAWSGRLQTPLGPGYLTEAFSQDGRYVEVLLVSGKYLFRDSGRYAITQNGPNQIRVTSHLEEYLPRQICKQSAGAPPNCQPFQLPQETTGIVTFQSSSMIQVQPEGQPSFSAQRDANPYLLRQQVSDQLTIVDDTPATYPNPVPQGLCQLGTTQCFNHYLRVCEQMATGGTWWVTGSQQCDTGGYTTNPYVSPYQPNPYQPYPTQRCDDMQQRRICAINNGSLYYVNGCLVCQN